MRKVRTIIITALLILLCFVLQCTVFRMFLFAGIGPNLMIGLTVSMSLMFGDRKGLAIGFCCGLLCDIFFGSALGFYALIYAFIGYLSGKFERLIYPDDMKLPSLTILGGDFIYGCLCFFFQFMIYGKLYFRYFLLHFVLPEMLYTLLVSLLLYPFVLFLYQHFMREVRESERNYANRDMPISGKAEKKS